MPHDQLSVSNRNVYSRRRKVENKYIIIALIMLLSWSRPQIDQMVPGTCKISLGSSSRQQSFVIYPATVSMEANSRRFGTEETCYDAL